VPEESAAMTASNDEHQAGGPAGSDSPDGNSRRGLWKGVLGFDSWLHSAASLSIVTLLAGWVGTYIQYLNAYEQKVSTQAQADMQDATKTFVDISDAYAEAQMQQQVLYFNFSATEDDTADAGNKALTTAAAKDVYPAYVKSRDALRQNSNIVARKAELYIDWAANLERDAADTIAVDGDPLKESLLGDYNFNCDANDNFAHFELPVAGEKPDKAAGAKKYEERKKFKETFCQASNETQSEASVGSETVFCAVDDNGKIDHSKPPLLINWLSAKHHVMVMHYCFETTHSLLLPARIWASGGPVSDKLMAKFGEGRKKGIYQDNLDHEVTRLDDFLSLVMSELERIRVKYRPSNFYCNLPLVNHLVRDPCTPIKTAKTRPQG
jgi:hypothetical protein